jgi:hypothetical protein
VRLSETPRLDHPSRKPVRLLHCPLVRLTSQAVVTSARLVAPTATGRASLRCFLGTLTLVATLIEISPSVMAHAEHLPDRIQRHDHRSVRQSAVTDRPDHLLDVAAGTHSNRRILLGALVDEPPANRVQAEVLEHT